MPNITRGGRMSGLMSYLVGPGRGNEHSAAHLVAGDPAVMAWHDDNELDNKAALQIGWELDHPRRAFGTRVTTALKDKDGHVVGQKDAHVWHCSLSLRADEPALSDERWAAISEQFVAEMGFADPASDEPPCRWVALRHGPSMGGNDHIHIAVGLVHEDGSKANVWNDRERAQTIAGALERRHGLQVVQSRETGHSGRGEKPAERANAQRRGAAEVARPANEAVANGTKRTARAREARPPRRALRDATRADGERPCAIALVARPAGRWPRGRPVG